MRSCSDEPNRVVLDEDCGRLLELWAGKAMGGKNIKRKADGGLVCEITEESLRPPSKILSWMFM